MPFSAALKLKERIRMARSLSINPFRACIIFEVGANNGETFSYYTDIFPRFKFYAFEPTPQLLRVLNEKYQHKENYIIIPCAVGELAGKSKFNIAGQADWGCSSLLSFSEGLEKTWAGRSDLKVTEIIDIDVIRLDNYIESFNIKRIDFLHVDAQGMDLDVLKSLGRYISIVQAGVIEVPHNDRVRLYKNQFTRKQAFEFLEKNGLHVWKIESQMNEDNVFYRKPKFAMHKLFI